jgi:protein TonB
MSVAPYPARAALSWARSPVEDLLVKPRANGRVGDWKYASVRRPRVVLWLAMFASAAFHVIMIAGFNRRAEVVVEAAAGEEIIRMELPPLPKEEEPPVEEFSEEAPDDPGMAVPTLADIPSRVPLATDFVQTLQVNVPLDSSQMATDLSRVPVQIAHKPSAAGLKDLFDLAQLDRVPEPIAQPAPVFPFELKNQVDRANVLVEFIVTSDGHVQYATVVSATHAGFERAAVDGVSKWRFRPGIKAGRKVNTRMRVPLVFKVVADQS